MLAPGDNVVHLRRESPSRKEALPRPCPGSSLRSPAQVPGQRPALRYGGGTAVRQRFPQSVSIQGSSSGISREDCPRPGRSGGTAPGPAPVEAESPVFAGDTVLEIRSHASARHRPPPPRQAWVPGRAEEEDCRPPPGVFPGGAAVPGSHAAQERTPRLCLVRWGPRSWGGRCLNPPPLGKILLRPVCVLTVLI